MYALKYASASYVPLSLDVTPTLRTHSQSFPSSSPFIALFESPIPHSRYILEPVCDDIGLVATTLLMLVIKDDPPRPRSLIGWSVMSLRA